MKNQKEKKVFFKEKIESINVFLFLGFNLTLVSILGFIWLNSSMENLV